MNKLGFLTIRFLDLSETFIYEPLQLIRDYEITVFALQRRKAKNFPYNRVYTWDDLSGLKYELNRLLANFGQEKYLLSKMRSSEIKLLHAHYGYMGVFALQYQRQLQIPLVTSFYGLDVYQHSRSYFYRRQLRALFKSGNLFLACSQKMRQDLIALGAPASRTRVHYGGADLQRFTYSFKPFEPQEDITVLMCGRFVEKKGFEYGLNAFLKIAKENRRWKLKIIGGGQLEARLKGLVAASPFGDQVQFLGEKNYDQYIAELKACQVFVSPSVTARNGDREGLPTVLIEAAALGKPLLGTHHSGIPEIVHHGQNGLLSAERDIDGLAENLKQLLTEVQLWSKYAEYGRRLVEAEFDFAKQINKLQGYYQECLSL